VGKWREGTGCCAAWHVGPVMGARASGFFQPCPGGGHWNLSSGGVLESQLRRCGPATLTFCIESAAQALENLDYLVKQLEDYRGVLILVVRDF